MSCANFDHDSPWSIIHLGLLAEVFATHVCTSATCKHRHVCICTCDMMHRSCYNSCVADPCDVTGDMRHRSSLCRFKVFRLHACSPPGLPTGIFRCQVTEIWYFSNAFETKSYRWAVWLLKHFRARLAVKLGVYH